MLAKKFTNLLRGEEISPPHYNSAIFVQSSGWNEHKYFEKYYKDKTPLPVFVLAKKGEGLMVYPVVKTKKLAEEIFLKYWDDRNTLKIINKKFNHLAEQIDRIYRKLSYNYIEHERPTVYLPILKKANNATWRLNALGFFSLYFDKEFCLGLIQVLRISISPDRLNELWLRATDPVAQSFEKRRELELYESVADGKPWPEIVEKCQYFEANYNNVSSLEEVEKILKKRYDECLSVIDAKAKLKQENKKIRAKEDNFNRWFKKLSHVERRLIVYIQEIMKLRDARKDYIAKKLVVVYRVAKRIFYLAGVSDDLIYFYDFSELLKGHNFLKRNYPQLKNRPKGMAFLINYHGKKEKEYGRYNMNKKIINEYFLAQNDQRFTNIKKIIGQTGCSGKAKGKVRVIMDLLKDQYKFKQGDVLVTGMTRPEFVPLIKKASAIITDEGGISCHAAIISRELGIPCIIGTNIASQVLKDGDLVEVDANKGIIYIIN